MQYKELADRHGLKEATVRKRANREGWQAERHALSRSVTEKATATLTTDRVSELEKFNADDLRIARAIREKAERMMASAETPADLRALAGAVDVAQKVGRLALGATTGNTGLSSPSGGAIAIRPAHDLTDDELASLASAGRG